MIFLLDYDRRQGRLLRIDVFSEEHREHARELRLAQELAYAREGLDREVMLLEASDETALRRTHRRYFENLSELVEMPS